MSNRAQADRERFSELFDQHHRAILAFALRRTSSPEDAADLTHDVFTVVWRRLDQVPPDPEARLWIYGVARLTLANIERGNLRRVRLTNRLMVLPESITADHADDVSTREAIVTAMEEMPREEREVIQLHAWEGLEFAEIAKVLSIPTATVRTRMFRARRRIRKALNQAESEASKSERITTPGHVVGKQLMLVAKEDR